MISKEINHIYWRWQEAIRERFENKGEQLTVAKPGNDGHLSILKEMMLNKGFTTEEANYVVLMLEKDKKAPPLDKAGKDEVDRLGLVWKGQGYGKEGKGKGITHKNVDGKLVKIDKKEKSPEIKQQQDSNFVKPGEEAETGQSTVDGDHLTSKTPKKKKKKPKTVDGKNKELNQSVDTLEQETFSRTETEPSDEDFEEANRESVADNPIDFEERMQQFEPHKFPKKYLKTFGRMLNTKLPLNSRTKSLTHYTKEGGAGEIRSQAGELIGMLASSIQDPKQREQFLNMLEEHMDNNDNNLIANKGWVKAARENNQAIDDSLNTEFPDGYEVVASAWDVDSEAEALGMEPPVGKNKGESTDQYMKVRTPDGKVHLIEISLKKDKKIRLTNTSPEALVNLSDFTEDEKKELEKNLDGMGIDDVPEPGDGRTDIEDIRKEAYSDYQQKKWLEFGNANRSEVIRLIRDGSIETAYPGLLRKLKIDPNNPEERLDELLNGAGAARARNNLMLQVAQQIPNGQAVIDDVNNNTKKVLSNITKAIGVEPIKSKMLEAIKEKLPLRSLVSGEESMAVGDFMMDKRTMAKVFGTNDFDKIKDDIEVDVNEVPPVIKYVGKGGGDPIVIATINIREEGIGYGNSLRFDMQLSNDFAKRSKEAHQSELNQAPRA
tara:strand:+ start:53 stop:2038 length:1986 start_codon:yes stop_codon:yes gene_type:complete